MAAKIIPGAVVVLESADASLGLGPHVRSLRAVAGLSQQDLAERLGTTQSAIARLEAGRQEPTVGTLRRLAAALDCRFVLHVDPDLAA